MTTSLETLNRVAIALAGTDFMWTAHNAPSQLDSAHRIGLTAWLQTAQNGLCAACGESLAGERVDLCHIVASRRSGHGIMAGNVYVGHVGCNSDDSKVFGNGAVPLASLIRADIVALAFPTRAECVSIAKGIRAKREARRAARIAAAGM